MNFIFNLLINLNDFLYDNQFAELKEKELTEGRLALLAQVEPFIGKYYSTEYVRKRILRQTDQEIIEIDEQIEDEIQKGILPDPSTVDPITGQPLPQEDPAAAGAEQLPGEGSGMEGMGADPMSMGEIPVEPDLDAQAAEMAAGIDQQYTKDTKKADL